MQNSNKKAKNKFWILGAVVLLIVIAAAVYVKRASENDVEGSEIGSEQASESLRVEETTATEESEVSNLIESESGVEDDETEKLLAGSEELFISLGSDVNIIDIDTYIGSFVEDGSDEFVSNVMMIIVENLGTESIQLATITINNKYVFELTTLLSGKEMMVLEKNRAPFESDMEITSVEISNVAFLDKELSLCQDVLQITGEDNMLTIKNISGDTFAGGKLFYKNMVNGQFLGGITYSGSIPELKAGETVKLTAKHYFKDSSELIFVTYAK